MVNRDILKEVLLENREMVENVRLVKRNFTFYDNFRHVLVGVRRSGKSFLLFQRMQELLAAGRTWDEMLYLNFEDDRLIGFDTQDFNEILTAHKEMGGSSKPMLFLDEVQNIAGWHKFARRLADRGYIVNITGSNAKMLSSDVATTLGGRYMIEHIFPFNLAEYHEASGKDAEDLLSYSDLKQHIDEYMLYGGFPECTSTPNKREYLLSVYQKIYLGDIAARHNIENKVALRLMFLKLAESVMQPIALTRLTNVLASTGTKVSKNTVLSYAEYAKNAFLLFPIKNFADHFTERETNRKYYFVDNGIISLLTFKNQAALLENLVAITLLRRYGIDDNVFFYHRNTEVDFVVPEKEMAIQVCYELGDENSETFRRETQAFVKFCKRTKYVDLTIITYNEERTVEVNGLNIDVVPIWKWLRED